MPQTNSSSKCCKWTAFLHLLYITLCSGDLAHGSISLNKCMVHMYFNHTVQPLAPSSLKQGHVIKPVYKDPGINIHLKSSQSNQVIKIRHWNYLREFNYWILRLAISPNYHLKKILRRVIRGFKEGPVEKTNKTVEQCLQNTKQTAPIVSKATNAFFLALSISPYCITTKLSASKCVSMLHYIYKSSKLYQNGH